MIDKLGSAPSLEALSDNVKSLLTESRFGDALDEIRHFVDFVINNPRSVARVFSNSSLDELCKEIAAAAVDKFISRNIGAKGQYAGVIILVTELVAAGGHVELIKDIIDLDLLGQKPVRLVVTDCFDRVDLKILARFSEAHNIEIICAEGRDSEERFTSLLRILCELAPSILMVLINNQDSLGIAAAYGNFAERVLYSHHGDHHLSLGAASREFIHIDYTEAAFRQCRHNLNARNVHYWPLTMKADAIVSRDPGFMKQSRLVTCASGRYSKFSAMRYRFSYIDILPKILEASHGQHIHIGDLPEEVLAEIRQGLVSRNIDISDFIHIPWVPSLAKAFVELNVDLYISSFPLGGGKASVEAMAAGIPLLMHLNYRSPFLDGADIVYPECFRWSSESELMGILGTVTRDELVRQSLLARKHFETYHSPAALVAAAKHLGSDVVPDFPVIRPRQPDVLQTFLDDEESPEVLNLVEAHKALKHQYEIIHQEYVRVLDAYNSLVERVSSGKEG